MQLSARPEVAFAYLTDPEQMLRLSRRAGEVTVISFFRKPDGGYWYETEHSYAGQSARAFYETIVIVPAERIEVRVDGDISCVAVWELKPGEEGGTNAVLTLDYNLKPHLLQQMAQPLVQWNVRTAVNQMAAAAEKMIVE